MLDREFAKSPVASSSTEKTQVSNISQILAQMEHTLDTEVISKSHCGAVRVVGSRDQTCHHPCAAHALPVEPSRQPASKLLMRKEKSVCPDMKCSELQRVVQSPGRRKNPVVCVCVYVRVHLVRDFCLLTSSSKEAPTAAFKSMFNF